MDKPMADWPSGRVLAESPHYRCLKIRSDGKVGPGLAFTYTDTLAMCNWDMCGLAEKCEKGELSNKATGPKLKRKPLEESAKLKRRT